MFSWIDILETMGQDDCHFLYVNLITFSPTKKVPRSDLRTQSAVSVESSTCYCATKTAFAIWRGLEMKEQFKKVFREQDSASGNFPPELQNPNRNGRNDDDGLAFP